MATEILSDSGPVLAVPMGSECFLPLWNAREHPCNVSTGSATPQQSQPSHTGKGSPLSACVRVCVQAEAKGFAIIRNNTLVFFGGEH